MPAVRAPLVRPLSEAPASEGECAFGVGDESGAEEAGEDKEWE